jgi:hypothetical protein
MGLVGLSLPLAEGTARGRTIEVGPGEAVRQVSRSIGVPYQICEGDLECLVLDIMHARRGDR